MRAQGLARRTPPTPASQSTRRVDRCRVARRRRARCGCRSRRSRPRSPASRRERKTASVGAKLLRREREPAAQIQRRGRVVEPQREDAHRPIIKFAALTRAAKALARLGSGRRLLASRQLLRAGRRHRLSSRPAATKLLLAPRARRRRLGTARRLGERGDGGGRWSAGWSIFERDGRMATYAAMVVACALALWWVGFRSRG